MIILLLIPLEVIRLPYSTSIAPYVTAMEASSPINDPISYLINLGVAGVWLVMFATGKVSSGKEVSRLEAEIARLHEELEKKSSLIEAFQTQILGSTLPALSKSAQALEALPSSERAVYHQLETAITKLADLTERIDSRGSGR